MGSVLSTLEAALYSFASVPSAYKYDVFLSFHGQDVRKGFVSNLHDELKNTGHIKPFKDDEELQIGMLISPNLVKAIEESRFAIVVLSPNYATSKWCLDELVTIFRCMEMEGNKDRILPVFYNVEPSDVRNQRKSFEEALSRHRENSTQDPEKVEQWSTALTKVGNLSGWDLKKFKSERELIKNIVEYVWRKVHHAQRRELIKYIVGCGCGRVQKVLPQSLEDYLGQHFSVGPYGSNYRRKSFDDGINLTVRQLIICYGIQRIESIWIEYDVGGSSLWQKHGNQSPSLSTSTVKLEYPDEYLTSISGYHEKFWWLRSQITSLTFKSNKRTYGPFGDCSAQTNFSIAAPKSKIVGFHGRLSGFIGLCAIGAHFKLLDH